MLFDTLFLPYLVNRRYRLSTDGIKFSQGLLTLRKMSTFCSIPSVSSVVMAELRIVLIKSTADLIFRFKALLIFKRHFKPQSLFLERNRATMTLIETVELKSNRNDFMFQSEDRIPLLHVCFTRLFRSKHFTFFVIFAASG